MTTGIQNATHMRVTYINIPRNEGKLECKMNKDNFPHLNLNIFGQDNYLMPVLQYSGLNLHWSPFGTL